MTHASNISTEFLSAAASCVRELKKRGFVKKLWARDASISKTALFGWLDSPSFMMERRAELREFSESVRKEFSAVVLLGMGGSALSPFVFSRVFGPQKGFPSFSVLDSTDPCAIKRVENAMDRTLFIVSSKSGKTLEVECLFEYFYEKVPDGKHFVAITDAGSPFHEKAREKKFLRTFLNPPDIGGRFSALSWFGLLPAAIMGIEAERILSGALAMVEACKREEDANEAVFLGAALAASALGGRDKVTVLLPEEFSSFALWIEQMLAESTGKAGRGLIPVTLEERQEKYSADRVFVGYNASLKRFEQERHPCISLEIPDAYSLGKEFFRWEIATVAASGVLGVDPFDQPDVEETKKRTAGILKGERRVPSLFEGKGYRAGFGESTLRRMAGGEPLRDFFELLKEGGYIAVLSYLDPGDEEQFHAASDVRSFLSRRLGCATLFGYGPRYLHSTGQIFKGGPPKGVFLIIAKEGAALPIPGRGYSFGELELSQALGDMQALEARGLPAAFVTISGPVAEALRDLERRLREALSP
jgi:glucose-6-phosphate isomerase